MKRIVFSLIMILGVATAWAQTITVGPPSGFISGCLGSPSFSPYIINFIVSGTNVKGNITATAPANFEISLNETSGFRTSVTIQPTLGTVNNVTIYVRSAASSGSGNITGSIVLNTPGVNQGVFVKGYVSEKSNVNTVNNQVVTSGTAIQAINFAGNANAFTWVNNTPGIGLASSGSGDIQSFIPINTTSAPITATVTVTPHFAGFAYVADNSGRTSVINTVSNKVTSTILLSGAAKGIAISPDKNKVYMCVSLASKVAVVDAVANNVVNEISVTTPLSVGAFRTNPQAVIISPDGSKLYVANANTDPLTVSLPSPNNTVSVINTATEQVEETIQMNGNRPFYIDISPDGKFIYTTNNITQNISVISTATNSIVKTINTSAVPAGIQVSKDGRYIYTGNTNGFNFVTVVDIASGTVIKEIPVGTSPGTITLSPDGSRLYVANLTSNNISVINTVTNTVIATIPSTRVIGLSTNGDGTLLYAVNSGGPVSVFNTGTYQLVTSVGIYPGPLVNGNFITPGINCSGVPTTFTITVNPGPTIVATGNLPSLTTTYGTPSSPASFMVSGSMLIAGILVTSPPGFEVSLNNTNFSKTLRIGQVGNVTNIPIYIRLAASAKVGNYSGDIVLSSTNAPNVVVPTSVSTVTQAPLTVTADNKTKMYGYYNAILTISYKGFVNNEGPNNLNTLPAATTTADTYSQIGQYAITVSGAVSPDYSFTYLSGILTITPIIDIPNTFTPNNDGVNDTWNIKNMEYYPTATIEVFNRYGQIIHRSVGSYTAWNGSVKGSALPTGTYYYIINAGKGIKSISGWLAIVR